MKAAMVQATKMAVFFLVSAAIAGCASSNMAASRHGWQVQLVF